MGSNYRHRCPSRWWGLLPAVLVSGPPSFHVAQTLCFPGFNACPPPRLEFGAFFAKTDALAAVGDACVLQTTCFLERISPWRTRVQKSAVLWCFLRACFENHCKSLVKIKIRCPERPFWASRCGFVVLSKTTVKPMWKSKVCPQSAILCTRSRLKIIFSNIFFEERLRLERVCKVRARRALLLRFYRGSCSEAVFAPFGFLCGICIVFYAVLPLAGKEIVWNPR